MATNTTRRLTRASSRRSWEASGRYQSAAQHQARSKLRSAKGSAPQLSRTMGVMGSPSSPQMRLTPARRVGWSSTRVTWQPACASPTLLMPLTPAMP